VIIHANINTYIGNLERMSLGLLGSAYLTDSSDSSDDDEENSSLPPPKTEESEKKIPLVVEKLDNPFATASHGRIGSLLPKPSFLQEIQAPAATQGSKVVGNCSVFSNPFREAESAKAAVLEQHLEMTAGQRSENKMIDGKKVCWMFRKGRCRHGHKCSFAHDNDISSSLVEKMYTPKYDSEAQVADGKNAGSVAPLRTVGMQPDWRLQEAEENEEEARVRKKRPGLSQGLVPSKKAMKFHEKVYSK